jgi:hypothetical protein
MICAAPFTIVDEECSTAYTRVLIPCSIRAEIAVWRGTGFDPNPLEVRAHTGGVAMNKKIFALSAVLLFFGCHELHKIDTTPPAPPQGIRAAALDDAVELTWLRNTERDLAGYNVWVSDTYDGRYQLLGSTAGNDFVDHGASNGVRSYYAVTAYDFEGNESAMSRDVVYATPRPEGYGITLRDYRTLPGSAGYDFSTYSIGTYSDNYTDVFYEYYNGYAYLNVWTDTDIQDMGYTESLYEITTAPATGWAPSKSVEAIVGHTYVIWTWDDHYAKIRVTELTPTRVTFDWAYQVAPTNPDLKRAIPADGKRTGRVQSAVESR